MKQLIKKSAFFLLAAAVMAPASLLAQDVKEEKKEVEQIIITRKGDKNAKMVIELNGDKITVNGKPVDEKNDDISVYRSKDIRVRGFADRLAGTGAWNDNFALFNASEDRALLGVTTGKNDKGVEIIAITKDGAAEKAGLKKGDVITKIADKKIESPDDLSAAVREHKPGDKVSVTYLRDAKVQTVTAELGKWKGITSYVPSQNFNFNLQIPDAIEVPGYPLSGRAWTYSGSGPRLGLSVQDTEDGKGAKVIEVNEDGNAFKAGIREEDIITEVEGKAVGSADEVAKVVRESKDKTSVKVKLLRQGKTENIDIKIPRRLKTTNL